ncbi:MAG: SAM-dependent methyltransferase [Pseudomonadota bacterium]
MTFQSKCVHLIGAGVSPDLHFTRQGMKQIAEADCVAYYSDPSLDKVFDEAGVRNRVTLDDLYPHGGIDDESYEAVLKRIVGLLPENNYVVFVQQGNPRLGVTLADMLKDASEVEGFDFDVFPGISSLDTLMIDADRDPLEYGSVIIDANRLLLFSHRICPEFDYYIYHICSVGTRKTNIDDSSADNAIGLLQQHLLAAYPAEHRCKIIESNGAGIDSASVAVEVAIGNLPSALGEVTFGTTLFIPSIGRPPVNEVVLDLLMAE